MRYNDQDFNNFFNQHISFIWGKKQILFDETGEENPGPKLGNWDKEGFSNSPKLEIRISLWQLGLEIGSWTIHEMSPRGH